LLLSAFLAAQAAAEVTVRVVPATGTAASHVELTARSAPLAEVLDRLGRQIGMKVVYEGASPRQLVTLSLQGRSAPETVLALLEGQGLNFALVSDLTGTRVETLLVSGVAPSSGPSTPAATGGRSTPTTAFRRNLSPPPGSGPDTMEDDSEELEEDEVFDDPAASGVPVEGPGSGAAAQGDQAPNPVPTPQAPGQQTAPSPSFPVSPFAPQATPYTPQPFPPLPPGVPGGPTAPATPQAKPETPTQPPPGQDP
jgi:hypothetical protein